MILCAENEQVKRAMLIMVILLLAGIPVSAQGTSGIQRHVIASGGSTNGNLVGAIGQPMAGKLTVSSGTLCYGFWCHDLSDVIIQPARVIYRITFGNIGVMVVVSALVVLVVSRKFYDVTFSLWRKR